MTYVGVTGGINHGSGSDELQAVFGVDKHTFDTPIVQLRIHERGEVTQADPSLQDNLVTHPLADFKLEGDGSTMPVGKADVSRAESVLAGFAPSSATMCSTISLKMPLITGYAPSRE
jgi:hypothetical protein